jgi:type IV pilus assembly protein PilM
MANIVDTLRGLIPQGLSGAFSGGGKSVVGIDIGSSSIKVVQLRKSSGSAMLETYGELSLGPYGGVEIGRATKLPPDKLAEALIDVMVESNVTTKQCGVSVPFSSSLITLITMPALPDAQLAKMIPLEARKYIPVPISEVQLDWFIVPDEQAKYYSKDVKEEEVPEGDRKKYEQVSVLLVAIHNEMANHYTEVLSLSKLVPLFYEIEIFSTIRSVLDRSTAPVVILDIGAANTKLYVVEYGIVKVTHLIGRGAQDITLTLANTLGISVARAEELKRELGLLGAGTKKEDMQHVSEVVSRTMQYVFSEANRAILNFQKRFNKNVTKVILTGGGAALVGIDRLAQEHFEMEVLVASPFSAVQTPAFLEDVLKQAGPGFSTAMGLALRALQDK